MIREREARVVTVISWDAQRGYGFARAAGVQEDVFVHWRSVENGTAQDVDGKTRLRHGQKLRGELIDGPRGKRLERASRVA